MNVKYRVTFCAPATKPSIDHAAMIESNSAPLLGIATFAVEHALPESTVPVNDSKASALFPRRPHSYGTRQLSSKLLR